MRMSNNIVRPITMTKGSLVFKFHPGPTLNFINYRFKHLAIFTNVGKKFRLTLNFLLF